MKFIIAVIKPFKLEEVREALTDRTILVSVIVVFVAGYADGHFGVQDQERLAQTFIQVAGRAGDLAIHDLDVGRTRTLSGRPQREIEVAGSLRAQRGVDVCALQKQGRDHPRRGTALQPAIGKW